MKCGPRTSLFRRFTDTNIYRTGSVKIWIIRCTKYPSIYGYFYSEPGDKHFYLEGIYNYGLYLWLLDNGRAQTSVVLLELCVHLTLDSLQFLLDVSQIRVQMSFQPVGVPQTTCSRDVHVVADGV